jgi:hypothetical protein
VRLPRLIRASRWRPHVAPKRRLTVNALHSAVPRRRRFQRRPYRRYGRPTPHRNSNTTQELPVFQLTSSGDAMGAGGEVAAWLLFSASRTDARLCDEPVCRRDLVKMPLLRSAEGCVPRNLQHQQWHVTGQRSWRLRLASFSGAPRFAGSAYPPSRHIGPR